jgi:D-beta-D-heptose 7-phosphate kinase/D-beta-D-heptose 1-phosphate adenosyltransferase
VTAAERLAQLDKLAGAAVLVIGDAMLDRFVYGEAERLSPEAPVPVLHETRVTEMLGGAGNVARNLAALGAFCHFIGAAGDDADGDALAALLDGVPRLSRALIPFGDGRPTSRKTRYVAGGHQLLRADRESAAALSDAATAALLAAIRAAPRPGAIVLSDYGKGVIAPAVVAAALARGMDDMAPVLVDPKGRDFTKYRGAALVTPNRTELAEATAMPTAEDAQVEAALRRIQATAGITNVLGTRGARGMTLLDFEGAVTHIAAESREVFDVSGAGDTVIATVAAGIASGLPLIDAVRLANTAAGIVVGKAGTAVATPAEIAEALHREGGAATAEKIVPRERAAARVAAWRARGQVVGFTNGCFDLLHPGHLHLIEQARRHCDRLVVGLNADASVKRLKGAARPVQNEAARAAVLAALAHVDLVVPFEEDTPAALIAALLPGVLVKGADYKGKLVVGADIVERHGGKVVLADLLPGHSTTGTIARLGPR